MTYKVDVIVIGAGTVGLAIARAVAAQGREVVILERHQRVGEETSSRNSGVIHSGVYYPTGSLKARLCVRGRELLYRYSTERGITHRKLGKIIVAQENQLAKLTALRHRAAANGVDDLQWLTAAEVKQLEPRLRCAAGLFSPSTGIIDVHEFMVSLWADVEAANGIIAFGSELLSAAFTDLAIVATVRSGTVVSQLSCDWLINSAGLHAIGLLAKFAGYPANLHRKAHFAKGNYFSYAGGKPFRHLVYPMPNEAGLGTHATLDLDGTVRFGPDVQWTDELDYYVDPERCEGFYDDIRSYWPGIPAGSLHPAYAGIRPKLVGAGAPAADFLIEEPSVHGMPGLINLLGIESPGLTASLAIAEYVAIVTSGAAFSDS